MVSFNFWRPYALLAKRRFSFKNPLLSTLQMVTDCEEGDPRPRRLGDHLGVRAGSQAPCPPCCGHLPAKLSFSGPPFARSLFFHSLAQDLSVLTFHSKESGFELFYLRYFFRFCSLISTVYLLLLYSCFCYGS